MTQFCIRGWKCYGGATRKVFALVVKGDRCGTVSLSLYPAWSMNVMAGVQQPFCSHELREAKCYEDLAKQRDTALAPDRLYQAAKLSSTKSFGFLAM